MKKLFALLAVVLAVVSCQRDADDLNVAMGGEQEVMLTVSLPETTRANSAQGFDIANIASTQYTLRYILEIHYNGKVLREEPKYSDSSTVVFPVRLAPDKEYTFAIWADIVDEVTKTNHFYTIGENGLSNIEFTNWATNANSELRDAYTCTMTKKFNAGVDLSMTLTRPFAKIRVISTDIADVRKFDLNPTSVEVEYTKSMYTSFNAVTGANDSTTENFKHVVTLDEHHTYADFDTPEATLFADYILVDPDGTIQFTMDVKAGNTLIKSTPFNTPIPVVANKLTTIKGDVLTTGGNVSVKVESGLEEFKTITIVDTPEDLQEVIKNADDNTSVNIELGGDIDLGAIAGIMSTRAGENAGLVIPANKTVVLDLKSHNLTYASDIQGNSMILNNGNLTIKGTTGKISYKFKGEPDPSFSKGNQTINNCGLLTIEASVENTTEKMSHANYVINTNAGATLVVNDGASIVSKNTQAVRMVSFGSDANSMTVNGGYIEGTRAIQLHLPGGNSSANAKPMDLTINGGELKTFEETYNLAIYAMSNGESAAETKITINDGTLNGNFMINAAMTNTMAANAIEINGGAFNGKYGVYSYSENAEKKAETITIKDGSFSTLSSIVYLAENCTYTLNSNVDDAETVVFNGKGTLDLNGKTVTTAFAEGSETNHQYAFDNKGELTIKDSVGKGEIFARGNFNYGKMTLESGTIYAFDCNGGYGIRNYEGAEFVMNGGAIIANNEEDHQVDEGGYDATTLRVDEGATATINGGIINNISDYTFAIDNYGTTTVNGGTISSIHTTVTNYGAMTINDGSFTCNGIEGKTQHVLWAAEGTTTINGGTFDGKDNYNGFNVDASEGATVYIKGGKFLPVHSGSLYGEGTIEVTDGEFFDDPSARVAEGYKAVKGENGYWTIANDPAAQIGATKYDSLQEAFNVGGDITLLRNVTIAETVTLAEGKTAVLELNGKTITGTMHKSVGHVIKNVGTLTVKNGTIKSTANNGGSAVMNTGRMTIEKVTLNGARNADDSWPSYTVNNTGTMTVENTTITSYHGAVASYGDDAVVTLNNCTIDMAGIPGFTSHGIYTYNNGKVVVNGGTYENKATDQNSSGASVINGAVEVNAGTFFGRIENYSGTPVLKGGTFSVKPNAKFIAEGYKAIQNEDGSWSVITVAMIGETKYATLNDAVAAVEDGDTITLVANEVFTTENRTHNSGTWYDGLYYVGDKSFTIDLGGKTISQDGAVNDYLLNFKNDGAKANTITLKNGTVDAGTAAFCALCTSSSNKSKITINLEKVNLVGNNSNGSVAKIRGGAELNIKKETVITGKNSYLGIECVASTVNIYDGAEIYMNGTSSYNGCLAGACGGGTINVYGGYGKGVKGGFIAMTSGGTINVSGGEWIANRDGAIGNNSNLYVLTAQSNIQESGFVGGAYINVTGGTFRGGMDAWVLNNHKDEEAKLSISGGNFNANPTTYLEEGYTATENNGIYTVSANN